MWVIMASLRVKPERKNDFLAALLEDAEATMAKEDYVLAFDIIEDELDPNRLHLYEVYRDQAAHELHKQSPHFLKWRDTVAEWYDEPLTVKRGHSLFPPDA
ncbi:MAG: putative quinol monooxygenase, partial [Chloroflexota bacterium]